MNVIKLRTPREVRKQPAPTKKRLSYRGRVGATAWLHWQSVTYAKMLYDALKGPERFAQLVGQMQIGKTEIIEALAYHIWKAHKGKRKVYVVSSIPLIQLRHQDEQRYSNAFVTYLTKFHLRKMLGKSARLADHFERDAVIVVDESHWGSEKDQIIPKTLITKAAKESGLRLVLVSATPFNTLFSAKFREISTMVRVDAKDYPEYRGAEYFYDNRSCLVTDIGPLDGDFIVRKTNKFKAWVYDNFAPALDLFADEASKSKTGQGKVFIIRTQRRESGQRVEKWIKRRHPGMLVVHFNQHNKVNMDLWRHQEEPIVVILQALLTVGMTIPWKRAIWGVWENKGVQASDMQAVFGRICGHCTNGDTNEHIKLFINLASLEDYVHFIRHGLPSDRVKPHTRVDSRYKGKSRSLPERRIVRREIVDVTSELKILRTYLGKNSTELRQCGELLESALNLAVSKGLISSDELVTWTQERGRVPIYIAASASNTHIKEHFDKGTEPTGQRFKRQSEQSITLIIDNRLSKDIPRKNKVRVEIMRRYFAVNQDLPVDAAGNDTRDLTRDSDGYSTNNLNNN